MQEILTDILTWTWFSEPHGYNFNGYLVRHAGGEPLRRPRPARRARPGRNRARRRREDSSDQPQSFARVEDRSRTDRRADSHPSRRRASRARSGRHDRRRPADRRATSDRWWSNPRPASHPEKSCCIGPSADCCRRRRDRRQPAREVRDAARKGHGRSAAPSAKRTQSSRAGFRRRCCSVTERRSSTMRKRGCASWSARFRARC